MGKTKIEYVKNKQHPYEVNQTKKRVSFWNIGEAISSIRSYFSPKSNRVKDSLNENVTVKENDNQENIEVEKDPVKYPDIPIFKPEPVKPKSVTTIDIIKKIRKPKSRVMDSSKDSNFIFHPKELPFEHAFSTPYRKEVMEKKNLEKQKKTREQYIKNHLDDYYEEKRSVNECAKRTKRFFTQELFRPEENTTNINNKRRKIEEKKSVNVNWVSPPKEQPLIYMTSTAKRLLGILKDCENPSSYNTNDFELPPINFKLKKKRKPKTIPQPKSEAFYQQQSGIKEINLEKQSGLVLNESKMSNTPSPDPSIENITTDQITADIIPSSDNITIESFRNKIDGIGNEEIKNDGIGLDEKYQTPLKEDEEEIENERKSDDKLQWEMDKGNNKKSDDEVEDNGINTVEFGVPSPGDYGSFLPYPGFSDGFVNGKPDEEERKERKDDDNKQKEKTQEEVIELEEKKPKKKSKMDETKSENLFSTDESKTDVGNAFGFSDFSFGGENKGFDDVEFSEKEKNSDGFNFDVLSSEINEKSDEKKEEIKQVEEKDQNEFPYENIGLKFNSNQSNDFNFTMNENVDEKEPKINVSENEDSLTLLKKRKNEIEDSFTQPNKKSKSEDGSSKNVFDFGKSSFSSDITNNKNSGVWLQGSNNDFLFGNSEDNKMDSIDSQKDDSQDLFEKESNNNIINEKVENSSLEIIQEDINDINDINEDSKEKETKNGTDSAETKVAGFEKFDFSTSTSDSVTEVPKKKNESGFSFDISIFDVEPTEKGKVEETGKKTNDITPFTFGSGNEESYLEDKSGKDNLFNDKKKENDTWGNVELGGKEDFVNKDVFGNNDLGGDLGGFDDEGFGGFGENSLGGFGDFGDQNDEDGSGFDNPISIDDNNGGDMSFKGGDMSFKINVDPSSFASGKENKKKKKGFRSKRKSRMK